MDQENSGGQISPSGFVPPWTAGITVLLGSTWMTFCPLLYNTVTAGGVWHTQATRSPFPRLLPGLKYSPCFLASLEGGRGHMAGFVHWNVGGSERTHLQVGPLNPTCGLCRTLNLSLFDCPLVEYA